MPCHGIRTAPAAHGERQNDVEDAVRVTRDRGVAAMSALILAVLLAALDQTIVSTALPRIAHDLDGFDDIAWVGAALFLPEGGRSGRGR
ncbi:hypothetical protein GCM10010254_59800 [Streptomyces chromofuscus]|nr:hypothetical protein GCM10010254_59800 [Streptomyces chromofuscus]